MSELRTVLAGTSVHSVYQPIVDLDSGAVVGFEALARGPEGPLATPMALFAAARAEDRLIELDLACRTAAVRGALAAGVRSPATLFVNVEPEALRGEDPVALMDTLSAGRHEGDQSLSVVLEITERALAARPAELLRTVHRARRLGWRIALDDVGVEPASLTFIPLLAPDIVKLDMSLVHQRASAAVAETMHVVNAYAEQSGALILAEGIETEANIGTARALGATLGQGWHFGRPASQVPAGAVMRGLALPDPQASDVAASPFACLPAGTMLRRSSKRLLIELSKHLEEQAARAGHTAVLASTFQHVRHFTPATARRYRRLADRVGFVAAIGQGMPAAPVPGVRGSTIGAGDPIVREWDVVVAGPQTHVALLARDLGDDGPDLEREFEYALTYQTDIVRGALQSLITRTPPQAGPDALVVPSAEQDPDGKVRTSARTPGPSLDHHDRPADPITDGPERMSGAIADRAMAATSGGVAIVDMQAPDQPLVYVNAALESLTGRAAAELVGQNCRVLQGPDTDRVVVARIAAAIAAEQEIHETLLNYRRVRDRLEPWWNEVHLSPVRDQHGTVVQYVGLQNDVSDRIDAARTQDRERETSAQYLRQIERLAFTDSLTGLANRRQIEERVESGLALIVHQQEFLGLLYLDLDRFKAVNDNLGHRAGDEVLKVVGRRLRSSVSAGDSVARLGGDEFLLAIFGLPAPGAHAQIATLAERVRTVVDQPIALGSEVVQVHTSVGWAVAPEDGSTFGELLHLSDLRMYDAKRLDR